MMAPGAALNVQPRNFRAFAVARRSVCGLEFNNGKGMLDMEADIGALVIGIMITVCALGFSLSAYLRSARIKKPSPERLRQFIEIAPMDRLKPAGGDAFDIPKDKIGGKGADLRDRAPCSTARVVFRLNGSLSVEIGRERGSASPGCNFNPRQTE